MTRYLLDINVLIALIDPAHLQHDRAHAWFAASGKKSWATCPLTENGLLRIVGHARYPDSPGTPAAVSEILTALRTLPGHVFWPDDISPLDAKLFDVKRITESGRVTDTYLLALASAHGGQLATFDHRLITDAVVNGAGALHLIR